MLTVGLLPFSAKGNTYFYVDKCARSTSFVFVRRRTYIIRAYEHEGKLSSVIVHNYAILLFMLFFLLSRTSVLLVLTSVFELLPTMMLCGSKPFSLFWKRTVCSVRLPTDRESITSALYFIEHCAYFCDLGTPFVRTPLLFKILDNIVPCANTSDRYLPGNEKILHYCVLYCTYFHFHRR
jgi:hypothetical protein